MSNRDEARVRIPWSASAVLGLKQRNGDSFVPECFGLTLAEAIDRATAPDLPTGCRACIWVNWDGKEILLHGRQITRLAARLNRLRSSA